MIQSTRKTCACIIWYTVIWQEIPMLTPGLPLWDTWRNVLKWSTTITWINHNLSYGRYPYINPVLIRYRNSIWWHLPQNTSQFCAPYIISDKDTLSIWRWTREHHCHPWVAIYFLGYRIWGCVSSAGLFRVGWLWEYLYFIFFWHEIGNMIH